MSSEAAEQGNKDGLKGEKNSWEYAFNDDYRKAFDHAEGLRTREQYEHDWRTQGIAADCLGARFAYEQAGKSKEFQDGYNKKSLDLGHSTEAQQKISDKQEPTSSNYSYTDYSYSGNYVSPSSIPQTKTLPIPSVVRHTNWFWAILLFPFFFVLYPIAWICWLIIGYIVVTVLLGAPLSLLFWVGWPFSTWLIVQLLIKGIWSLSHS